MARFKNGLLVAVGFALAGVIGAAFGTGTAHAVVASLVEVVNPSTSPVPTSPVNVTDPGRIAYQSFNNATGTCSGNFCTVSSPAVPSGHRVVVQHIGGNLSLNSTVATVSIEIFSGGQPISTFFAPTTSVTTFAAFDQPVLFYVDSGNVVKLNVNIWGAAAWASVWNRSL